MPPREFLMRLAAVLCLATLFSTACLAFAGDVPEQKVDQIFSAYAKSGAPGCSVGVVRDGNFIYKKSFGEASIELGVPITSKSVFYLASVSKQFTSASVVLAADKGYLSLDDDVHKYIPELPDYGHPVTLRQMANHTAGFRDYFALLFLAGRDPAQISSSAEVFDLIKRQRALNFVPGDEYSYSNSNYFLLAEVIKRATKKSLAEFASENIFQPLGMKNTRYFDDHTLIVPNRVAAYDEAKDGKYKVDWSTSFDLVGSGGLMSSVDDLIQWDRNYYNDKLAHGTLVKSLMTQGVLNNGHRINYSLGLWLDKYRGLPIIEHGGGTFGYRTEILRFPEQHFSVIELCNVSNANPGDRARKIADLYLADQLQPERAATASGKFPDPAPFSGTYFDARKHMIYIFSTKDGNLVAWESPLHRTGEKTFQDLVGDPITFTETDGKMIATLDTGGERYFDGTRITPAHLDEAALHNLVGRYHSDELDTDYTISIEKGALMVKMRENSPLKLEPINADEFYVEDFATIQFRFGADHRATGLAVFTQSARGIEFTKTGDR